MGNLSEALINVNARVKAMRHYQHSTRKFAMKDFHLISDNENYVTRRSLGQVVLIIACGIIQIYFVKKLFEHPIKIKPRV